MENENKAELPTSETKSACLPSYNFFGDRHEEIKALEKDGWKLCVGCINYSGESLDCITCPIETRKIMGLPPEDSQKQL